MKIEVFYHLWTLILMNLWYFNDGTKNIRLQDYLCSDKFIIALQKPFRGDPLFTLTEDRDSAAIVTQTWNKTVPGFYISNKLKYDCQFRVKTSGRHGIYTVITRLKLRQNRLNGGCLDYIKFKGGNRSPSEPICNETSVEGHFNFDQRYGDMTILIHIDKEHMIQEPLELRMVFTAHSECKYTGDFLCDPKDPYSCISQHLVRDNVTNCIFPYRDEVSCCNDAITAESIDPTNVAISALVSLVFTMLGVGFCVWICWKYWNCITVQGPEAESRNISTTMSETQMQREPPVIEMPNAPSFHDVIVVNLPQDQPVQTPTPKDLPPSYESLFPER